MQNSLVFRLKFVLLIGFLTCAFLGNNLHAEKRVELTFDQYLQVLDSNLFSATLLLDWIKVESGDAIREDLKKHKYSISYNPEGDYFMQLVKTPSGHEVICGKEIQKYYNQKIMKAFFCGLLVSMVNNETKEKSFSDTFNVIIQYIANGAQVPTLDELPGNLLKGYMAYSQGEKQWKLYEEEYFSYKDNAVSIKISDLEYSLTEHFPKPDPTINVSIAYKKGIIPKENEDKTLQSFSLYIGRNFQRLLTKNKIKSDIVAPENQLTVDDDNLQLRLFVEDYFFGQLFKRPYLRIYWEIYGSDQDPLRFGHIQIDNESDWSHTTHAFNTKLTSIIVSMRGKK